MCDNSIVEWFFYCMTLGVGVVGVTVYICARECKLGGWGAFEKPRLLIIRGMRLLARVLYNMQL